MRFQLLETVVLVRDLPTQGLRTGDLGTVVEVYDPNGVEVEFVTAAGRTQALVVLADSDLRRVEPTDLVAVRRLTRSA